MMVTFQSEGFTKGRSPWSTAASMLGSVRSAGRAVCITAVWHEVDAKAVTMGATCRVGDTVRHRGGRRSPQQAFGVTVPETVAEMWRPGLWGCWYTTCRWKFSLMSVTAMRSSIPMAERRGHLLPGLIRLDATGYPRPGVFRVTVSVRRSGPLEVMRSWEMRSRRRGRASGGRRNRR
jgi:hypothetical protein